MVWAARLKGTRGFQKIVAVKTMLPKLSEDDQFEQMFLDEASLASQIRHPHVVEILDLGEQDGVLFLVMEWIDGVPLNQLMKAAKRVGGIPIAVAVRIVMQACAGLHAAHELRDPGGKLVGLVHRDVSPQNILVTYDGVTKVVDFGVAKATALNDGMTAAGQVKGKVAYMAPEQVRGLAIDRRVDVFAMGIVLYALTTGKHPFRRETEAATMYNIASPTPAVAPHTIAASYPPELEAVVLRALSKDPDKRFATTNEMLRALDALPASVRASTDEDVAQFVRELLLDKRQERSNALTKALALADQQASTRIDLRELMSDRPSATTLTPVTQNHQQNVSPSVTHTSLSGQTHNSVSNLIALAPDPTIRRRRWVLGGIASAAAIALATLLFVSSGRSKKNDPKPAAAPARPTAAATARAVEEEPAEPSSLDAGAAAAQPDEPAVGSAPSAPPKPPEAGPARKPSPPRRAPVRSTPSESAGSKPPAEPNWKHNPGF